MTVPKILIAITDTPQEEIDVAKTNGLTLSGKTFTFTLDVSARELVADTWREWVMGHSEELLQDIDTGARSGVLDGWEWEIQ